MTDTTLTRLISADDIADALGRPRPTPQQRAVIESDLEPALVVAGAGSGKTETMAGRVLWLVANGRVRPAGILGLTFTRKAAGELAARIRERIAQLAALGMVPDHDEFETPTVATYNSFANAIYRDNAILLGRESDGVVLGEAAAWQLARSVVVKSMDERLPDLEKNLDPITEAVLRLSRALAENVVDPTAVRDLAARFTAVAELPLGGRGAYREVDELVEKIGALDVLVDLAVEYSRAKQLRSAVEYSDQVAFALEIVRKQPKVADDFRREFPVVLLDEYQDTSVVQTWLLAEMFRGHPVMAVGDPNQSIYGWRGASASNLDDFAKQFAAGGEPFALSTSWRNGTRILDAANAIVAPFAATARVPVERLVPSPVATTHPVDGVFTETIEQEAEAVAAWFEQQLRAEEKPSLAMLFRARKAQGYFLRALRRRGIPYHVLGIGGLLAEPEVADLVSTLSVLHDPSAGLELIRLLAGSRWRIGVQDLHALSRLASWLRDRDYAGRSLDDEVREAMRSSLAEGEGGSIVEALDFIGTAKPDHSQLERFSAEGVERLRKAGRMLARLRSRVGLDLPDLVTVVEQELQLDLEVLANDARSPDRAAMEAFFDALDGYLAIDDAATLGGFLAWLRLAEEREDLSPRPEDPEPGTVQVLTVHGSKGLEWDAVAVPRMVVDELPAKPVEGTTGWLAFGQLPWPFRGDAADLPEFAWSEATSRKELLDEQKRFKQAVGERQLAEERRLAYVAVTRARHRLLVSGSFWATQLKPRDPSPFLRDLEAAGVLPALPPAPEAEENPLGDDVERIAWPVDPLGGRRGAVEAAAEAVRTAVPGLCGPESRDLELLLEERDRADALSGLLPLPDRVPASRFKDFVTDPASVAAGLRRPMPERPYRATRLGTLFHSWVERRYGLGGGTDELDALGTEADLGTAVDEAALAALLETFERSPWADRKPIEVEREVHLPFAGRIVICKIDAIYQEGDRYEVVDWKTGKAPRDADDLEQKQLQLALYRLAYSRWRGIDPDLIDAVFYFVADDRIIRPQRIYDEEELLALWNGTFG